MNLATEDRRALELMVNRAIEEIPDQMAAYHLPEINKLMRGTEQKDLLLGMGLGYIFGRYLNYFFMNNIRFPRLEEQKEIYQVILKKSDELKEAIFRSD
jgi:hypothetical protein